MCAHVHASHVYASRMKASHKHDYRVNILHMHTSVITCARIEHHAHITVPLARIGRVRITCAHITGARIPVVRIPLARTVHASALSRAAHLARMCPCIKHARLLNVQSRIKGARIACAFASVRARARIVRARSRICMH
eukprot:3036930-Pleurochrysis_carterae.AAC.2